MLRLVQPGETFDANNIAPLRPAPAMTNVNFLPSDVVAVEFKNNATVYVLSPYADSEEIILLTLNTKQLFVGPRLGKPYITDVGFSPSSVGSLLTHNLTARIHNIPALENGVKVGLSGIKSLIVEAGNTTQLVYLRKPAFADPTLG